MQLLRAYVIIKTMDASLKMLIDEGYTFHLGDDEKLVIGSDPKADVVVKNNMSISRKHALLEYEKGTLFLTCFGQTSVFLNGFAIHNLERTQLQENDLIKLSESGPELLVEELGVEKKVASEKRKKQAARIRRGFYLLFLLVSFITFIILYMDSNFNLRIVELISNKNFSLSNLPFFSIWGKNDNKADVSDKQPSVSWLTDKATLAILDSQLQELSKENEQASNRSKHAVENQILPPATKFTDATFLLLSTDETDRIISRGMAYAVKQDGFFCTLALYISGAEHIYLKNKEHYWLAQAVYQNKELGIALLRAPLDVKPLPIRIINKKDIGIDVYALNFMRLTQAYTQPLVSETEAQRLSGNAQSDKSPITLKKGMLSGLTHDGVNLASDITLSGDEAGGLLVDTNNTVLGIVALHSPAESISAAAQPAIIHIKTISDLKEFNDKKAEFK